MRFQPLLGLRDFESAYEEVSRTAAVSANQIPGDLKKDKSSASGVDAVSSGSSTSSDSSSMNKTSSLIGINSSNKSLGVYQSSSYFWEGVIFSKENGKLKVKAFEVIGSEMMPNFVLAMPPTLECVGRITSHKFLDNLKLKELNGQGVVVVTFLPVETEREVFCSLINHMKQGRIVVTKPFCEVVEDFYIVLLLKDDAVLRDANLFSADNSYFQNQKDDLLLGVAVFSKQHSY
uniref:Spen paralogue and orthologue SPOC C-terminal domain-containing protein n=1 Tax=Daphnia galeata TaxID=27404 RepID=A0A8J2RZP8_9CRUS|nr:unnamed protein product [Daphnia galeata]